MEEKSFYRIDQKDLPSINLINQVQINPPYIHQRRQLDEYVLYLIISGDMYLSENDIEYHLTKNDMIILSPEHEHFGLKASECEYYYIHFNSNMWEDRIKPDFRESLLRRRFESLRSNVEGFGVRKYDIIIPKLHHFKNDASVMDIINDIREIISYGKDKREFFSVKADCMLMELFVDIAREYTSEMLFETKATSTKSAKKIFEILNYFNVSYKDDISGNNIEELFNCNFDYINRIFKQATGRTIFNYLNELRVTKAKELLEGGFYTITDIAEMTGFNDAYYFSKVFKKYADITPGKYARMKKKL